MRIVACAFVALALGTVAGAPASAQCVGPNCEGSRAGPPPYFIDRAPNEGAPPNSERPAYRGEPRDDGPPPDRSGAAGPRPWPAASERIERRPVPAYRRANPSNPSEAYRQFWDERDDRRVRSNASRSDPRDAPSQRYPTYRTAPPSPRNATSSDKVTISMAEYHTLQDQARELQRLLSLLREFRERDDHRERRDFHDRGEYRDMRPGPGPSVIYR